MDPVVEEEEQGVDDVGADAAEAFGQDVGAEQKHGADGGFRERIAEAAGMAADEVALEVLEFGGVDADVRKFAEAGIDAVGGFAAGEEGIDDGAGGLDAGQGGGVESDGAGFERDLGDSVEGKRLTGRGEVAWTSFLRLQVAGDRCTGFRCGGTGWGGGLGAAGRRFLR